MLDAEQWKIVLRVYAGHPIAALSLAYQLVAIKQSVQRGKRGIPDAIVGLDLAIESLYRRTDFYRVSHKLYLRRLEGNLRQTKKKNSVSLA